MFKVALIVAFSHDINSSKNPMEYLGFSCLAAYLKMHKIDVDIIDAYLENLSINEIVKRITSRRYNLIGFTLMSSDYFNNTKKILDLLPNDYIKSTHLTVGGYFSSFNREKLLQDEKRIDTLIVGEGEKTLLELCISLERNQGFENIKGLIYRNKNKFKINPSRNKMTEDELNKLPMPFHYGIDYIVSNGGTVQVASSRGCYGRCGFCGVNMFNLMQRGKRWRAIKPEIVVKEIYELAYKHNVKYINFADEEFIGPGEEGKSRAIQIAKKIIDSKLNIKFCIFSRSDSIDKEVIYTLKKAGLDRVFLGVEFGTQALLDFYNKGIKVEDNIRAIKIIKNANVNVSYGYMMFEPQMDIHMFIENLDFFHKYLPFKMKFLPRKVGIYYNSNAYQKLRNLIEIKDKVKFDNSVGDCCNYKFKDFRVAAVYELFNDCLSSISPSKGYTYIINFIRTDKRDYFIKVWSDQFYSIIRKMLDKIALEQNIDKEKYYHYKVCFKKQLIDWDNTFYIECSKEYLINNGYSGGRNFT